MVETLRENAQILRIMTNPKAGRHQDWREILAIPSVIGIARKRLGAFILFCSFLLPIPCAAAFSVIGKYALPNRL